VIAMLKARLRSVRYLLATLATVAFGLSLN
jgi:hypothetical protein